MFVLCCIAVLGLVVAVLCVGLTVALLYQYYKQTIALNAMISYTAEKIGVDEDYLREIIIKIKRKV